jgi:hypothetical protein
MIDARPRSKRTGALGLRLPRSPGTLAASSDDSSQSVTRAAKVKVPSPTEISETSA